MNSMEEKKKKLVNQLIAHFEGDKARVKAVGDGCKLLGYDLSNEKNLDAIVKHPEAFFTIITMSDFGVLNKLDEALTILKQ